MAGALLLSVEAIKVKNLRDGASRLHRAVARRFSARREAMRYWTTIDFMWYVTGLVGTVAIVFFALQIPPSYLWREKYIETRVFFGFVYVATAVIVVLIIMPTVSLIAAAAAVGASRVASAAISWVEVVERRTADGTFGMGGAVLLVSGFAFQIVGA
jgi:hypothetical protein